ncbi:MAG: phosphoribosylamine--glycine ligase [Candidatus Omnitrophica bacterium]|nr:phosphoribosylamine--glycine ligase [Candidatus Omnitrophota bacterium]
MKILVVGSGGREHALVWKIAQSPLAEKIYCAPGNGGIEDIAQCLDIAADDINALLDFASREKIDLTVVGPEAPLAEGIVDLFKSKGLKIFGPSKLASRLESSKVFAKHIMKKYNIPTAGFEEFTTVESALRFVKDAGRPLVIKADGLCAGKGVFVCATIEGQEQAINSILKDKTFGDCGSRIIIEECLLGQEASIIVISDGDNVITMASSQDHKRAFDGDLGPNTGGMGAYSPAPVVTSEVLKFIQEKIIIPAVKGMNSEGTPFSGVLYAGVMITKDGPKVLEFNVRFGDPETQAILPRLKSDLLEVILKSVDKKLEGHTLEWDARDCVCVVAASGGYPGEYEKGKIIKGLTDVAWPEQGMVFHAGTKKQEGQILTSGGRVLGVTSMGNDIKSAIDNAYAALDKISFEGMFFRGDIGKKALRKG